jgi:hypothetical protein
MDSVTIDEAWYVDDQKTVLTLLRSIQQQQETHHRNYMQTLNAYNDVLEQHKETHARILQRLEQLNTRLSKLEIMERNINKALDELTIIKEREINCMIREHIPFPFHHPSPIARFPIRRHFNSKAKDL